MSWEERKMEKKEKDQEIHRLILTSLNGLKLKQAIANLSNNSTINKELRLRATVLVGTDFYFGATDQDYFEFYNEHLAHLN